MVISCRWRKLSGCEVNVPPDNFFGERFRDQTSCTKLHQTTSQLQAQVLHRVANCIEGLSSATLHWGGHHTQQLPSFPAVTQQLLPTISSAALPLSSLTPPPLSLSLFPLLPGSPSSLLLSPSYSPLSLVASLPWSQLVFFLRPVDHSPRTAPRGYFGSSLPHHRWRTEYHSSAPSTPQAWSQVWLSQTVREIREPNSGNIVHYHLTVCINCSRDFIMRMTSMSTQVDRERGVEGS